MEELVLAWRKALKILKVLAAGTSIGSGVNLESHLVDTTCDVKDQWAVLLLLRASGKALGQAKLKQIGETRINPIRREPFDLASGRLLRVRLVRLAEEEQILLLCVAALGMGIQGADTLRQRTSRRV